MSGNDDRERNQKKLKRIAASFGIGSNFIQNIKSEALRDRLFRFRKSKLSIIGLAMFLFFVVFAILSPFIVPYPKEVGAYVNFSQALRPVSLTHLFGTDEFGRDIFSRAFVGSRITIFVGLIIPIIGAAIGVPLGLVAGYVGGKVEAVIMRVTDVFLSIPPLIIAILVIGAMGHSMTSIIFGLSIDWWSWYVRMVHAETLSVKQQNYIEASRMLGTGRARIIFSHILPNSVFPVIVKITLDMGYAILNVASLGFLGLGIYPPTPELGAMVAEGRLYLPADWWVSFFPALIILLIILSINFIGDGMRDVLDVEVT
jgi:peptide/nickel transport system permease protein